MMPAAQLPKDPQQLQLMFQVARSVVAAPDQQAPDLGALQRQAVDLLDADAGAAQRLSLNLVQWQGSPRVAADRFLGDLSVQMGMDAAKLTSEPAALNRIANLSQALGGAQPGLPSDVQLPAGELSSTWDGQHARLATDFPQIVAGRTDAPGQIGLEDLLDTLPDTIGAPPNSVSKDDLRQRVLATLAQGVRPRDHLQPGGIVASELVAMLAGVKAGDHVVDLCAGEHGTSIHLAKNLGAQVSTYEVSDAATAVGRQKIAQQALQGRIDVHPVSISRMNVKQDSVQAMVGNNADGVHYVADRDALFQRMHDGLAPGGAAVLNAYIPGSKPDGVSDADWSQIKQGFTENMGWQGVNPKDISSEGYRDQLVQAGFRPEDVEIIDLGPLYHRFHERVMDSMAARDSRDGWLADWLQRSEQSGQHMGAIVRARKSD